MRLRSIIAALVATALIAACSGSGEETTTTEGPTTTEGTPTTQGTSPSTTATEETWVPPEVQAQGECLYLTQYVVVPEGALSAVAGDLIAMGVLESAVEAGEILALSEDPANGDDPTYGVAEESIEAVLDFYQTSHDPLAVVQYLHEEVGVAEASVIHGMAPAVHWRMAPGTNPAQVDYQFDDPRSEPTPGQYIGVVDSGIVDPEEMGLPAEEYAWLFPFVVHDISDVETPPPTPTVPASHGTFVASILRRMAPSYGVSLAKARRMPVASDFSTPGIIEYNSPTTGVIGPMPTELNVAEAVDRVLARSEAPLSALNLSLGAYLCDPESDAGLLTLQTALDSAGIPVFAAGGNDQTEVPFWPAALTTTVTGVGALDLSNDPVVWDASLKPVPEPSRPWISVYSPGVEIIGVGGDSGYPVVSWSGSSFATSVALAGLLANGSPAATYGDAFGLTYLDNSGQPKEVSGP